MISFASYPPARLRLNILRSGAPVNFILLGPIPSVVRLETLHVELHALLNPFFQRNTVECPNLESFTILHYGYIPWELPQWIPAGIHKLVLQGTTHFNFYPNST